MSDPQRSQPQERLCNTALFVLLAGVGLTIFAEYGGGCPAAAAPSGYRGENLLWESNRARTSVPARWLGWPGSDAPADPAPEPDDSGLTL